MIKRREFIAGIAAAWPLAARAQQPPLPLIAYLSGGTAISGASELTGFRQGLGEMGFVEGRNVHIEYRWADGQYDRLRPLVTELIGHNPAVIVVSPLSAAIAAKALTTTPIIFTSGNDPVDSGLVNSLNRPGGNVTGVNTQLYLLIPKRLQILRELVPNAQTIAMLVNPDFPIATSSSADAAAVAAPILKIKVDFWRARTDSELDDVFARSAHGADALLVNPDNFFLIRNKRIVELAQRHSMPAMYPYSDNVVEGGLISYGANRFDVGHQKGIYTGRILKGDKPADLPVVQPTKIELMINMKTAKELGLTVPQSILLSADEVIE